MSFLESLYDRVLVCDGAMGSMLYDRGVFVNQSFEALNLTRPELVVEVHRAYVDAGADVIETNTFGANPLKLAGFGLADRFVEINIAGARLARQAAGASGYVAGAIGRARGQGGGRRVDERRSGRDAFRRAGCCACSRGVSTSCCSRPSAPSASSRPRSAPFGACLRCRSLRRWRPARMGSVSTVSPQSSSPAPCRPTVRPWSG